MGKLTIAEVEELTATALTAPSLPGWVHVREVDFDCTPPDETAPDQVLVDYWMQYLYRHLPETGEVTLREVLADLAELVEHFRSLYALNLLDSYIGPLVWRSPERELLVGEIEAVRDRSPDEVKVGWDNFLADCRDSSWTLKGGA